jgi:hypothetical protein
MRIDLAPRPSTTTSTSAIFTQRVGDRLDDARLLADRRIDGDVQPRMALARLLHEARQVARHVSAGAEERRHDANRGRALARQLVQRFRERRARQLEIGEPYLGGRLLREQRGEALERLRPLRVARAVREQDDRLRRAQWSVARRPS